MGGLAFSRNDGIGLDHSCFPHRIVAFSQELIREGDASLTEGCARRNNLNERSSNGIDSIFLQILEYFTPLPENERLNLKLPEVVRDYQK